MKACQKALEIEPNFLVALDSLGYTCLMAGNYEEAIGHFLKAIDSQPDYPDAWRHLLHAYKRSGSDEMFASAHAYLKDFLPREAAAVDEEVKTGRIA